MIDLHSHILPYIDDGAKSMEESIAMLDVAKSIGIDTIVATPHLKKLGAITGLNEVYVEVERYARERNIQLYQAYEFHASLLMDVSPRELKYYCIPRTNLLLLEFSSSMLPPNLVSVVDSILRQNIRPIIAHPERYKEVQENIKLMQDLAAMGCCLQISGKSMYPLWWNKKRRTAKRLLKQREHVYLSSDAHRVQDYQRLGKVLKKGYPMMDVLPARQSQPI